MPLFSFEDEFDFHSFIAMYTTNFKRWKFRNMSRTFTNNYYSFFKWKNLNQTQWSLIHLKDMSFVFSDFISVSTKNVAFWIKMKILLLLIHIKDKNIYN